MDIKKNMYERIKANINIIAFGVIILSYVISLIVTNITFMQEGSIVKTSEVITLVIYSIILISAFNNARKKKKKFTLTIAFLVMFALFMLSIIILDLLGLSIFGMTNFFTTYEFSYSVKINILNILQVALLGLYFGNIISWIFSKKGNRVISKKTDNLKVDIFSKIGLFLFVIGYIPSLYKTILEINLAREKGYIAIYTDIIHTGHIINVLATFTVIGFALVLAFSKSNKIINTVIVLYLVNIASSLLTGARAKAFVMIIIILVYLCNKYREKVKFRYLIISIAAMVIVGQSISFIRNSESINHKNFIVSFLEQQGGSYTLIGYVDQYQDKFTDEYKKEIPFKRVINMFKYNKLTGKVLSPINTIERAKDGNLAPGISYVVNPYAYSRGLGLGGCYLASVWLGYGVIGIFIINILVALLLNYLDEKSGNEPFYMFLLLLGGAELIFIPRGILLNFIPAIVRPLEVYFLIYIIYRVRKKRVQKNRT